MKQLTCQHCGHIGPDVVVQAEYVGGEGDVLMTLCSNRIYCWRRWDEQHGLPQRVEA